MSMHPSETGSVTEAIILAELVKRGYRVLTPFGMNHRYDLVIDHGDRFERVQCKTGRLRNGVVIFNATSWSVGSKIKGQRYTDQADSFIVYCPDNDQLYKVPLADIGEATKPYLRVEPTANGRKYKNSRYAQDYLLCPVGANG